MLKTQELNFTVKQMSEENIKLLIEDTFNRITENAHDERYVQDQLTIIDILQCGLKEKV